VTNNNIQKNNRAIKTIAAITLTYNIMAASAMIKMAFVMIDFIYLDFYMTHIILVVELIRYHFFDWYFLTQHYFI
jgi:hypothetical protein